jgi:hypothetical protein
VRFLPAPTHTETHRRWFSWPPIAVLVAVVVVAVIAAIAVTRPKPEPPSQETTSAAERTQPQTQTPLPTLAEGTHLLGMPNNGESAVIAIDNAKRLLTIEQNLHDATYPTCSNFQAVASDGGNIGLSGLLPGDFAMVDIGASGDCVSSVSLLDPPSPPQCNSDGMPGSGVVTWKGFNERAHSILYRPTGDNQGVLATRWCERLPTVTRRDGSVISLSGIPKDASIQMITSADEWVTSITVQ